MKRITKFVPFGLCLLVILLSCSLLSTYVLNVNEERCLVKQDLSEAQKNQLCWVVVDQNIYDVTKSVWWSNGSFQEHRCGEILSSEELKKKGLSINQLLDYYEDMAYVSKAGKLCDERTLEKPENCGNASCDIDENFRNCPQDCPPWVKDKICIPFKDFLCDPDCGRMYDPDCICNNNRVCETEFEDHENCPMDCPPAYQDELCYKRIDGFCDPDCNRTEDPDCACNKDGVCEQELENYTNCPIDCPSGAKDSFCDKVYDQICDPDCAPSEDPDCVKETTTTEQTYKTLGTALTTEATANNPETKKPLDASSLIVYLGALIPFVAGVYFIGKEIEKRRIKKQREEFLKWKTDQVKLGK